MSISDHRMPHIPWGGVVGVIRRRHDDGGEPTIEVTDTSIREWLASAERRPAAAELMPAPVPSSSSALTRTLPVRGDDTIVLRPKVPVGFFGGFFKRFSHNARVWKTRIRVGEQRWARIEQHAQRSVDRMAFMHRCHNYAWDQFDAWLSEAAGRRRADMAAREGHELARQYHERGSGVMQVVVAESAHQIVARSLASSGNRTLGLRKPSAPQQGSKAGASL